MNIKENTSLSVRMQGAWFGLVVGDALGAPYEFLPEHELVELPDNLSMRAGYIWEAGEWTDDTALTLATAQAYAQPQFNPKAAAEAMIAWLHAEPKDVGNTTRSALKAIQSGVATYETAGDLVAAAHPGGAANGSLMRCLPTAMVRSADDPRLVEETRILSRITHATSRCVDACVGYNQAVAALIAGADVAVALQSAGTGIDDADVRQTVQRVTVGKAPRYCNEDGIGFVMLAFERALCALRDAKDFRSGMLQVVRLGGDTDTNAAIAGGLLGARFGYGAIPQDWLDALMQRSLLEGCLANLVSQRQADGQLRSATPAFAEAR